MQVAVDEAFGTKNSSSRADRQHLGMGGGVLHLQRSVAGSGDDVARLVGHHRPNRHLAPGCGGFGLMEGNFKGGWQIQSHRAN